jgi:hypothetical protein
MTSWHDAAVAGAPAGEPGGRAWPGLDRHRTEAVASGESAILGAVGGDLGGIRHYRPRRLVLTDAAATRRQVAANGHSLWAPE